MAAAKTSRLDGARKPRHKISRNVTNGHVYIKSTFNNTTVSFANPTGTIVAWAFSGQVGFKGSRKSAPFATQLMTEAAACHAQEHGMKRVDVFVKGPGSDRETTARSFQAAGLGIGSIQSVTPQAFNGTCPSKRRCG